MMENQNSKKSTDHRALPESQTDDSLEYLGEEWDFWWPVSVEITAEPEE